MVHENDDARGGCAFGIFFDGRTPEDLKQGGIYSDLALALYSASFWPVSVALVAGVLGATNAGLRGGGFRTATAVRGAVRGPPQALEGSAPESSQQPTKKMPLSRSMTRGAIDAAAAARSESKKKGDTAGRKLSVRPDGRMLPGTSTEGSSSELGPLAC